MNSATNIPGPRIQFEATTYDFGRVMSGELVRHEFAFTNTGSRDLVLGKVWAGCGCTKVLDWTQRVEPGAVGRVTVQLDGAGLIGAVTKTANGTCNDPRRPAFALDLKGVVWRAIDVNPAVVMLNLNPESPMGSAVVHITNRLEAPLLLWAPESTNGSFGCELRTNLFGREYQVVISNSAPLAASAVTRVALRTSVAKLPPIGISVYASVSPVLSIVPKKIDLAHSPLVSNQMAYVTLVNHSTNPITVFEPAVPGKDVAVSLKETRRGSVFTAALSLPAGFTVPAGQPAWLSLKTSHPLYPVVRVPICGPSAGTAPVAPLVQRAPAAEAGLAGGGAKQGRGKPSSVPGGGTAPMPLVFRTQSLASLGLDDEQRADLEALKKQFVAEIGGWNQDPGDPAYLARWQKALEKADNELAGVVGRRAIAELESARPAAEEGGN